MTKATEGIPTPAEVTFSVPYTHQTTKKRSKYVTNESELKRGKHFYNSEVRTMQAVLMVRVLSER
jgi:hypothetical protein